MDRWAGRVALVTGAAGGMGSSVMKRLVKYGMKVVACDLDTKGIYTEAESLIDAKGELYPIRCNLRKEEEILSMFSEIKTKYGGVDVCLNVAGLVKPDSLLYGDTEQWRNMLEVNVLGLSICTREAIKTMKERGVDDGHVIHWSSIAGLLSVGIPDLSMYTATKHAVAALTEELRRELRLEKSNIRISCISPGFVKTGIFERMGGQKYVDKYCIPGVQMLTPDQVTDSVIHMLACPPEVQIHDIVIRPTTGEI